MRMETNMSVVGNKEWLVDKVLTRKKMAIYIEDRGIIITNTVRAKK